MKRDMDNLLVSLQNNKPFLIAIVSLTALILVMRNAFTKVVLKQLSEYELYAAKAVVSIVIQPLILIALIHLDLIDLQKISQMPNKSKAIIFFSVLVGVAIFSLSVYVLKHHKLTHIVTLQTAFQIIIACLIGYFLLQEKMSAREYLGIGLIVGGMLVMYYR